MKKRVKEINETYYPQVRMMGIWFYLNDNDEILCGNRFWLSLLRGDGYNSMASAKRSVNDYCGYISKNEKAITFHEVE